MEWNRITLRVENILNGLSMAWEGGHLDKSRVGIEDPHSLVTTPEGVKKKSRKEKKKGTFPPVKKKKKKKKKGGV